MRWYLERKGGWPCTYLFNYNSVVLFTFGSVRTCSNPEPRIRFKVQPLTRTRPKVRFGVHKKYQRTRLNRTSATLVSSPGMSFFVPFYWHLYTGNTTTTTSTTTVPPDHNNNDNIQLLPPPLLCHPTATTTTTRDGARDVYMSQAQVCLF